MSAIQFNAAAHNLAGDRQVLPKGKYKVIVHQSEVKANKSNSGTLLVLSFKVLEGLAVGATVQHNINIQHSNETTQRIGQQELSSICYAVGKINLTDTSQLHGPPLVIDVDTRFVPELDATGNAIKDDQGVAQGKTYNDVVGFFNADGSTITKGQAVTAAQPAPSWAPTATPVPATLTPTPAPVSPTPTTPLVTDTRKFSVAHNGKLLTPDSDHLITVAEIHALNIPLDQLMVAQFDGAAFGAWSKGDVLAVAPVPTPAPVPATPAGMPAWMAAQVATAGQ